MKNYKNIQSLIGGYFAFCLTVFEVSDVFLERFNIEGDYFNYIFSFLVIVFIVGGIIFYLKSKKIKQSEKVEVKSNTSYKAVNVILIISLFFLFGYYAYMNSSKNDLLNKELPELIELYENNKVLEVYKKAIILKEKFPDNKIIAKYFNDVTDSISIETGTIDYDIYFRINNDSLSDWKFIGKSYNLDRVPFARLDLKFVNGENTFISRYIHTYFLRQGKMSFVFPETDKDIPEDHILFAGVKNSLSLPGLDHLDPVTMNPYSISKFEVTNQEYYEFLNSDAYNDSNNWPFPIVIDKKTFTLSEVKSIFIDEYGAQGPSNWNYGNFPDGQKDFPVTGISWFEAYAYSKYKGLSLPNIYQWENAANLSGSTNLIKRSNFSKEQLIRYDNQETMNVFGIYNLAGNVREWMSNPNNDSKKNRAILGGCFLDETYSYNDYYSQDAFDRSIGNGIRLVYNPDKNPELNNESFGVDVRDFLNTEDVSDDVFKYYLSQYDYEYSDKKITTENIDSLSNGIVVEKYQMPAGYGDGKEILTGYVFYDKNINEKYKPIIYFPGSNALHTPEDVNMVESFPSRMLYLLKEGYALVHPIYKSTYSRQDEQRSDYGDMSDQYKNHVIMWGKDYKKSIDYIFTRKDFDSSKLSYHGISWGGFMANILLPLDERVKSAVLLVAGLEFQKCKKEVDAHYYTRRIKIPTIMLNGKFDQYFPYETSQIPMYKLIDVKEENKKHFIYESGHYVPRNELIKQHLEWLNKYL